MADVLGTANHVVVEGTLLLDEKEVLFLLEHTLALFVFQQVGAPIYQDIVLLASPAEVGHRSGRDDIRKKRFPRLPESGLAHDTVA